MREQLGKIKSVKFGAVGYQECQFGLSLTLGGEGWGVCSDICGGWDTERSEYAKWSEEDRIKAHGEMCVKVSQLLKDAKVDDVSKLIGKPVKCYFQGLALERFEILKEVL